VACAAMAAATCSRSWSARDGLRLTTTRQARGVREQGASVEPIPRRNGRGHMAFRPHRERPTHCSRIVTPVVTLTPRPLLTSRVTIPRLRSSPGAPRLRRVVMSVAGRDASASHAHAPHPCVGAPEGVGPMGFLTRTGDRADGIRLGCTAGSTRSAAAQGGRHGEPRGSAGSRTACSARGGLPTPSIPRSNGVTSRPPFSAATRKRGGRS
jgi:hypothetical protein